jgi:hypothetical protein
MTMRAVVQYAAAKKAACNRGVRRLAQHRAGITHLSMRVSWPGMGHHDILAGIALLGRQGLRLDF